MMTFLIYIAIILSVLTFAYLVRVFELASELKSKNPNEITEKDNRLMSRLFLLLLFGLFAFVGWNVYEYGPKMLPVAASEHGVKLDNLLNFNFGILWFVFIITHIFLFYFAYKYYGRKDGKATYYPHNNKLEMIWTIIPAIVLAVIVIWGIKTWNAITDEAPEDALVVEIYGKQFDWTARYAGTDNTLGDANYKLIAGANALGLDSASNAALDDIVTDELHLPVGKNIAMKFRARDVIHSAYFPHFRAQMNCVPGMTTVFQFKPTITTAEMRQNPEVISLMQQINSERAKNGLEAVEFDYVLVCNKICGTSHYKMKMNVIVETEEEYKKWLESKKPFFAKAAPEVKTEAVKDSVTITTDTTKISENKK